MAETYTGSVPLSFFQDPNLGWSGQQFGAQGSTTWGQIATKLGTTVEDLGKANQSWTNISDPNAVVDLSWLTQNMAGRLQAPGAAAAPLTQAQSDSYLQNQTAGQTATIDAADKAKQYTTDPTSAGPWIMVNGQQVANPAYKGPAVTPYDPNQNMTPPALDTGAQARAQQAAGIQLTPQSTPGIAGVPFAESQQVAGASTQATAATPTPQITAQPQAHIGNMTTPSLVDYLASAGMPNDLTSRANLAVQHGLVKSAQDYLNLAKAGANGAINSQLLGQLRAGSGSSNPPAITPPTPPKIVTDGTSHTTGNPAIDAALSAAGISPDSVTQSASKSPLNAATDYLSQALTALGATDAKKQFDDQNKEYSDLQTKKADEKNVVNNDPWLAQGVRDRTLAQIDKKYETRELILSNKLKNSEAIYSKIQDQAQWVAGQAMTLSHEQAVMDQNLMLKAFDLAQKQTEADNKHSPAYVEYQDAVSSGYKGSFVQYQNEDANRKLAIAKAGQNSDRVLSATEAQSLGVPFGTTASQAYGLQPTKPLTEAQGKDLTYANRADQANQVLNSMQATIAKYNPATWLGYKAAENTTIGNAFVPSEVQQIRQAERDFVTAILRRESGATINPSEFDTAEKQYFPQPGDSAATLAQKSQLRDTAITSFKISAGPSAFPKTTTQTGIGSQTPAQFVESSLQSQGLKYNDIISTTPKGQIPVIDNKTGQVGYILPSEFTSSYTKL